MIILEFIGFVLLFYLALSVSTYVYAVVKSYELINVWKFKVEDGYVGAIKLPKWLWLPFYMPLIKKHKEK